MKAVLRHQDLATLAASGESETLEFKATTGTRREAAMTVCSFLNQRGGQVLFGVTQAAVVVGQQVSERTIEELSAELRQIDPPGVSDRRTGPRGRRPWSDCSQHRPRRVKAVHLPR